MHYNNKYHDYQRLLAIKDQVIKELFSNEFGVNQNKLLWWLRVHYGLSRNDVVTILDLLHKSGDVEIEDNLYYLRPHLEVIDAAHSIVKYNRQQQN